MGSTWANPTARRYTVRLLGFMTLYIALLVPVDFWFRSATPPQGALRYAAAIAPALPIIGVIWAIGRFLVEMPDEYLRMKLIVSILWAMGLTLAICIIWGFLQNFASVPTPPVYMVFVLFCALMGVAQGLSSLLDRLRERGR